MIIYILYTWLYTWYTWLYTYTSLYPNVMYRYVKVSYFDRNCYLAYEILIDLKMITLFQQNLYFHSLFYNGYDWEQCQLLLVKAKFKIMFDLCFSQRGTFTLMQTLLGLWRELSWFLSTLLYISDEWFQNINSSPPQADDYYRMSSLKRPNSLHELVLYNFGFNCKAYKTAF